MANMTQMEEMKVKLEGLEVATNTDFVLTMGIVVFLMQGGFALLEAGSVRSKNTVNIIIKNVLDCLIGGIAYWAVGWAVTYGPGGNAFLGGSQFFGNGMESSMYAHWFFQYTFAATAATIVSGSIAERCQFGAYFFYSAAITGFVYPVICHWSWDPSGWSYQLGYHDFAGSGNVHMSSGLCALMATYCMGPRIGRFSKEGHPREMPGHSIPMAALGGFILLFGFLSFNGGSQGAISTEADAEIVGRAVVNTILGGSAGGLTVLVINKIMIGKRWSFLTCLNGTLAGMVVVCSGCDVYSTWAAIVCGMIGALAELGTHFLMLRFQLDDPLDAVAVHLGAGIPGLLLVPFFWDQEGIFWKGNTSEAWLKLGVNVAGGLAVAGWTAAWSFLIFWPLNFFNMLRIDRDTELRGVDIIKHGESAYPALAWVEAQYNIPIKGVSINEDGIPSYMAGNNEVAVKRTRSNSTNSIGVVNGGFTGNNSTNL